MQRIVIIIDRRNTLLGSETYPSRQRGEEVKHFRRSVLVGGAALAVLAAGCGSSTSASSTATTSGAGSTAAPAATASSPLGTPDKATKSPYLFGVINDEAGPITFPEARQGLIAGVDYVNNYLGGINGHPIQLASCISDASPAVSARCATQLVGQHPLAILGAADVGSPAAIPVYQRANLAYLGGIPFAPVEGNASNAVIFNSISLGDNAVGAVFVAKTLKAQSVADLYISNAQGEYSGLSIIAKVLKSSGVSNVSTIAIPPTAPDPTPEVAVAVKDNPNVIFVDVPNNCGEVLKAIKQLGYTGKVIAIDPCSAPPVIQAAAGGAENMYVVSPFVLQSGNSPQAHIFEAAMSKYAAAGTAIDSISTATFSEAVDVQRALSKVTGTLDTSSILNAFKTGSNHANFLSHPYTCNGKAIAGATSVCVNSYLVDQIKNGKITQASSTAWLSS